MKVACILFAAAALAAPSVAQTTLNATFTGSLTTSQPTPDPGQQTFTLTGGFTSYAASSNLPQITGGDLSSYSFTVSGLSSAYNAATRTVTYSNVGGTINGYGQVVQTLAPTTLTVAFDPTFATATILGSLVSSGATLPPGFPGVIDFTPANGAVIAGTYLSNGVSGGGGTVAGTILFASAAAVPEPASWAMMIGGFGMMGAGMRRRKLAVHFA